MLPRKPEQSASVRWVTLDDPDEDLLRMALLAFENCLLTILEVHPRPFL